MEKVKTVLKNFFNSLKTQAKKAHDTLVIPKVELRIIQIVGIALAALDLGAGLFISALVIGGLTAASIYFDRKAK